MVPGRNSELMAHARDSGALDSGLYTCSPSRLSLSMSVMDASSATYTFCVCRSPAQNRKSNTAACATWCDGTLSKTLGPSSGREHNALNAMPRAGDEKMPVWFTGTGSGWTDHGSKGKPAGAVPTTRATHDRVEMLSRPQKSLRRCKDSVLVTSRVSARVGTPGSHSVPCRGRPGMQTNLTNGEAGTETEAFPFSRAEAFVALVSKTADAAVARSADKPADSSSDAEKTPFARNTVAADAPVSRFTLTLSPSRFSPYVPLIRRRSTSHTPHAPWPRHPSRSLLETARDAAAQSTEHPSHGAHGFGSPRAFEETIASMASSAFPPSSSRPWLASRAGATSARGVARVSACQLSTAAATASAAPEPEDASACLATDPGPRTTVVAGSSTSS
mmetsp:Transcript_14724/g.62139  ORF Transcript_14724/g.62139 Transcript_14724/m.62139 type:complete len:389 (+) Transcript_14724:2251-3417(+)